MSTSLLAFLAVSAVVIATPGPDTAVTVRNVLLGLQSLRSALRAGPMSSPMARSAPSLRLPPVKAFRQGVINDLANPKMAVFFASVLPQFADHGKGMFSQLVALGITFARLTFAWLCFYSYLLGLAGDRLLSSRIRRAMDGLAGTALVGLGVRVATAER